MVAVPICPNYIESFFGVGTSVVQPLTGSLHVSCLAPQLFQIANSLRQDALSAREAAQQRLMDAWACSFSNGFEGGWQFVHVHLCLLVTSSDLTLASCQAGWLALRIELKAAQVISVTCYLRMTHVFPATWPVIEPGSSSNGSVFGDASDRRAHPGHELTDPHERPNHAGHRPQVID